LLGFEYEIERRCDYGGMNYFRWDSLRRNRKELR